ncbi:pleckstrin-like (PH) domain protein [Medicago truncatula]|uniref:Pleckstrin-like (PH) domain protein n=1 Tax=Medicago truncatula TaxID=3880 RepID=A0A072UDB0_MEDTR|nr:pleckstrin-like (PH) domain protein [Medicago truncatula]
MLKLFTLRGLPWSPGSGSREKVELTAAEVESLRSELVDLEEKEAQLKAQLENIDEILRSARLSGYLYIRTRWTELPGESPPIDDTNVDDWLPRFVVLQGECLFIYLLSTGCATNFYFICKAVFLTVMPLPDESLLYSLVGFAFFI